MILKDKKGRTFDIKLYKNFLVKGKGLMFSKKLGNKAILFENRRETMIFSMIHTLFVFQDIDVVWIDKNKKIVDIKRGIKPFKLNVRPCKKAKYFVEFSKGMSKGLKIGDALKWR